MVLKFKLSTKKNNEENVSLWIKLDYIEEEDEEDKKVVDVSK